jgi:undecaprenyl-diphosphatase
MTPAGLNETLFLHINAAPGTPDWMIKAAGITAVHLVVLVPLLLVFMWLTGRKEKRDTALFTVLAVSLSLLLSKIVAMVYPHPRPFMIGLGHQYLPHEANDSFPSDHATFFTAAAFALLAGRCPGPGLAIFAVGIAVSWARIYLGIHFPMDMAGALAIAAAGVALSRLLWKKIGGETTALAENLYRKIFKPFISRGWLRP